MTNNYTSAHHQESVQEGYDDIFVWELLLYRLGPDLLAKTDGNGDGDDLLEETDGDKEEIIDYNNNNNLKPPTKQKNKN